jgi:hypothetical protein
LDQFRNRVEALGDAFRIEQRSGNPGAKESRAGRRQRPIDGVQERSGARAVAEGPVDLERAKTGGIDHEMLRRLVRRETVDVLELASDRVAHVAEKPTRGGDRRRPSGQAEAVERGHVEVPLENFSGHARREGIGVGRGQRRTDRFGSCAVGPDEVFGVHDLARRERLETLAQGRPRLWTCLLPRQELTGRCVEKSRPDPAGHRRDRGDPSVGLTVELVRVVDRPGRDDTHDFAPHQPLRRLGIFHLVADRDTVAAAD